MRQPPDEGVATRSPSLKQTQNHDIDHRTPEGSRTPNQHTEPAPSHTPSCASANPSPGNQPSSRSTRNIRGTSPTRAQNRSRGARRPPPGPSPRRPTGRGPLKVHEKHSSTPLPTQPSSKDDAAPFSPPCEIPYGTEGTPEEKIEEATGRAGLGGAAASAPRLPETGTHHISGRVLAGRAPSLASCPTLV
jgi:hypothetical protein